MALNDFIRTPEDVIKALLRYESFEGGILEPCCGDGAISEVLKQGGYTVASSDNVDRGYGKNIDLFNITEVHENIITNPPFSKQKLVKRHLLGLTAKKCAMLWYAKNIGNELETKTSEGLKNIYVFRKPIQWEGAKINWRFAWYVWEKGWSGDITVKLIDY